MIKNLFTALVLFAVPALAQRPAVQHPYSNPYCDAAAEFDLPNGPFACVVAQACADACAADFQDAMVLASFNACNQYNAAYNKYTLESRAIGQEYYKCLTSAQNKIDAAWCLSQHNSSAGALGFGFTLDVKGVKETYEAAEGKAITDYWGCIAGCCISPKPPAQVVNVSLVGIRSRALTIPYLSWI